MCAWWLPRSSKPLWASDPCPAWFDSLPLRPLSLEVRITAEDFDEAAMLREPVEGGGDFLVLFMAEDVHEEKVFPVAAAAGTAFDAGHVDVEFVEGGESVEKGTGLVADAEHDGGAVAARGRASAFADHQKTGGVGGVVLDAGVEDVEAMQLGGEGPAESAGVWCSGGDFGGAGGAGDFDEVGFGEVFLEPKTALSEDGGVAVEGANFLAGAGGHQAVFDAQENLGADVEGAVGEEVQGVDGSALGGVFDRDDAVVSLAAGHGIEDLFETFDGSVIDAGTELIDGGLVGPCAGGAQEGDAEIVLQGEGGGHDFAVNGTDALLGEAAIGFGVFADEALKDGFLAFRGIDLEALGFLDDADFVNEVGAVVEQAQEFGVEGVDFFAQVFEWHGRKSGQ